MSLLFNCCFLCYCKVGLILKAHQWMVFALNCTFCPIRVYLPTEQDIFEWQGGINIKKAQPIGCAFHENILEDLFLKLFSKTGG